MTDYFHPTKAILMTALVIVALAMGTLGGSYYANLGSSILIVAIAAMGLNILSGYAGQISFAQAGFMAIGAYGFAITTKAFSSSSFLMDTGILVQLGIVFGILVSAICGVVLAFAAKNVRGPYLAMTTLAFSWIVWKILLEWVSVTGGDLGIGGIPKLMVGDSAIGDQGLYFFVLALAVITFGFISVLTSSPLGLSIRALNADAVAASSVGVDVEKARTIAFVLSAGIGGLAGSLFALTHSYINPDSFQVFDSIFIVLVVLIGGSGTKFGPIIGATLLVSLPEFLHQFGEYRLVVHGSLMLTIIFLLPHGIHGLFTSLIEPGSASKKWQSQSEGNTVDQEAGGTLEITDVHCQFGGLVALDNINIVVHAGTTHAIIGPNGAGKTTLINIVSRLLTNHSGSIKLNGKSFQCNSLDCAARAGIVRTFQNDLTQSNLSVFEHVCLASLGREKFRLVSLSRTLFGGDRRWLAAKLRSESLIQQFSLSAVEDEPLSSLDYGTRRLVEIARAVAAQPRVLILDEPAAGLNTAEKTRLAAMFQEIKSAGQTILLVDHDNHFVSQVADRVTALDHGIVIAEGTPADVFSSDEVRAIYLGENDELS